MRARVRTLFIPLLETDDHQRQLDTKRRTGPASVAVNLDRPDMHFDELLGDRQTETEPAVLACDARITLAETLEHIWKKFRRDADAGVADDQLEVRIGVLQANLHPRTAIGELHSVGHQIPENLLQPLGIARYWRLDGIENALDANISRIGGRPDRLDALSNDRLQIDGSHVEPNLAGNDPRHV